MPYTNAALPFAPGSHTSYKGAQYAAGTRAEKTATYLHYLSRRGPTTDQEASDDLGYPLASINSIRNGAMHAGLVCRVGISVISERSRSTWGLTDAGVAAVTAMRGAQ